MTRRAAIALLVIVSFGCFRTLHAQRVPKPAQTNIDLGKIVGGVFSDREFFVPVPGLKIPPRHRVSFRFNKEDVRYIHALAYNDGLHADGFSITLNTKSYGTRDVPIAVLLDSVAQYELHLRYEVVPSERNATIVFDNTVHDFGDVEQGQLLRHRFWFTNTGSSLLCIHGISDGPRIGSGGHDEDFIIDRRASKMDYAPGERGYVEVSYSAYRPLSAFTAALTLYTNDTASFKDTFKCQIRLNGNIVARKHGPRCLFLPAEYNFDTVRQGTPVSGLFKVVNTGDEKLRFTDSFWTPKEAVQGSYDGTVELPGKAISSGDTGIIRLSASTIGLAGRIRFPIYLHSNAITDYRAHALAVKGFVAFDTPACPVLSVPFLEKDLGDIKKGTEGAYEFEVKNTGGLSLVIHRANSSGGPLYVSDYPKELLPGKSGRIKVRISTGYAGPVTKPVTISSNSHCVGELNDGSTSSSVTVLLKYRVVE